MVRRFIAPWGGVLGQNAAKYAIIDLGQACQSCNDSTHKRRDGVACRRVGFPRLKRRRHEQGVRADNGPDTVRVKGNSWLRPGKPHCLATSCVAGSLQLYVPTVTPTPRPGATAAMTAPPTVGELGRVGMTRMNKHYSRGKDPEAMSYTWKRSAVALRLGLSGLIVFVSAACAATSTPTPPNTPGTEVTVRASSKASGTAVPTSTPVRKDSGTAMPTPTPAPKASGTAIPTPTPVPKAASEKAREIPVTVNGRADTSESIAIPRSDGTVGDSQAPPIPDKGELKYPNLGSGLDLLVASVEAGQATAEEDAADTPVHSGESVAVTGYLSGSVDAVVAFLEENGGDPRNAGKDYVEAYVTVTLLGLLSERPGVLRVREIVPPEPGQGR